MKSLISNKFGCFLLCTSLGVAIGEAAANTISIADSPLQTATGLPPNVLFVIDDSGSMRWGFTPDNLVTRLGTYSGYPRYFTEACSGAGAYAGATNTCFFDVTNKRYLASAHKNSAYFDPVKAYEPPINADGSSMPAASFTAARVNGFDNSSQTVDLTTNYRAIMDDFFYYGSFSGSWRSGFTISPGGNTGHAFYYSYIESCSYGEYDDRCYEYKQVADTDKVKFANWFSFYRTRMQTSKWAIGKAFANDRLSPDIRVGYGSINHTGVVKIDVGAFSGANRSNFYSTLYSQAAVGGTPLRGALAAAGSYFETDIPWRDNPDDADSPIRSCRQSFTMLMTDGYYDNNDNTGVGNADGTDGPLITGPGNQSGRYEAKAPFKDDYSNTLADIAMYYWKRDLQPNVDNRVPVRDAAYNPAFWQNMTTFGVSLGIPTELFPTNPDDAFLAIVPGTTIDWPDPAVRNSAKLDDLLHAAVNSRGGFFNAAKADEFADKLATALLQITKGTGSASNLGGVSTSSQAGARIFQGRYQGEDWAGDLWTYDADNNMQIAWKASEGIPAHGIRNIKYLKGSTLSNFNTGNVTSAELALSAAEATNKDKLVNYLRGEQTYELEQTDGIFRKRSSLLGDIAHSAPLYVGAAERRNYHRNGWPESASYLNYIDANKDRKGVVFVGANDGMLHAFSDNSALGGGAGKEIFAYVPKAVLPRLKHLADPDYQHQYYVDGVLAAGDVYINSGWKTLVLGTLGRGAAGTTNSIFALDATNPTAITPLWEMPYPELGQNTGKVLIARSINEQWVGIVGYGYNNSTNKGGIIIFDLATGAEVKKIALPNATASPNGFAQLESWDNDMDGNVDYVYAGDYQGNIWKFDISSSNTGQWGLANNNRPIFTAKIGAEVQPITSGISISREPETGKTWIMFGTGSYLSIADKASTSRQTIYGIVDESGDTNRTAGTLTRSDLKSRTYQESGDYRSLPESTALADTEKGWYIDLVDDGERVVLPPTMIDGVLVFNTLKPDDDPCMSGGISWRMAIDPYRGGRLKRNFFNTNNFIEGVPTSGVKTESPTVGYTIIKTTDESGDIFYVEVSGQGDATTPTPRRVNVVALGRRLTWRELTNE